MSTEKNRCPWCGTEPIYVKYHDEEWGQPIHDDRLLFEFLVLESFQAGLSWLTVLKKARKLPQSLRQFRCEKSIQI
jgi:DNA-3-methyladenine glycosylase I